MNKFDDYNDESIDPALYLPTSEEEDFKQEEGLNTPRFAPMIEQIKRKTIVPMSALDPKVVNNIADPDTL